MAQQPYGPPGGPPPQYDCLSTKMKFYVDNSFNRRVGRVGLPVGSMVIGSGRKYYVDNHFNRLVGRVGMPVGSMVIGAKDKEAILSVRKLQSLKADVQRSLELTDHDQDLGCRTAANTALEKLQADLMLYGGREDTDAAVEVEEVEVLRTEEVETDVEESVDIDCFDMVEETEEDLTQGPTPDVTMTDVEVSDYEVSGDVTLTEPHVVSELVLEQESQPEVRHSYVSSIGCALLQFGKKCLSKVAKVARCFFGCL